RGALVHAHRDAVLHVFLKASCRDLQLVVSHGKFQHNVAAITVGDYRARKTSFGLLHGYRCALHDCTQWIRDCAPNAAGDLLGRQTKASKHHKYQHIANVLHVVSKSPDRFGSRHVCIHAEMRVSYRFTLRVSPQTECRDYRQPTTAINNRKELLGGISGDSQLSIEGKQRNAEGVGIGKREKPAAATG